MDPSFDGVEGEEEDEILWTNKARIVPLFLRLLPRWQPQWAAVRFRWAEFFANENPPGQLDLFRDGSFLWTPLSRARWQRYPVLELSAREVLAAKVEGQRTGTLVIYTDDGSFLQFELRDARGLRDMLAQAGISEEPPEASTLEEARARDLIGFPKSLILPWVVSVALLIWSIIEREWSGIVPSGLILLAGVIFLAYSRLDRRKSRLDRQDPI